ncbi:hypothetical protein T02_13856, partial [Trichinella nativa]
LIEKERHRHVNKHITFKTDYFPSNNLCVWFPLQVFHLVSEVEDTKKAYKNHCLSLCITKSSDFEAIRNCYEESCLRKVGLRTKNTATLTCFVERDGSFVPYISRGCAAYYWVETQQRCLLSRAVMSCSISRQTLGLIYSDVVKKGILEEWRRKSAECFRGI